MSKGIFSDRLGQLMKERSVTQAQIAAKIGIAQPDVSRYLNGRVPGADVVHRIASHFGVSMDYFFGAEADSKGWDSNEPLPKNPNLDQLTSMADVATMNASALRVGAERFGRLNEMLPRIQSLEREAAALRALIEEMVAAGYAPGASPPSPAVSSGLSPEQIRAMVKKGGDQILQNMRSGPKPKPAK